MFIATYVIDWAADGRRRHTRTITNNQFLMNTNRMYEITDTYDGHASMFFFDNPADARDGGRRLKIWNTPASITLYADTDIISNSVTFDYFPEYDTSLATEEITLLKAQIAYCYPHNHDINSSYTWVHYAQDGWDMKKLLVNHAYFAVRDLLEPAPV